MSAQIFTYGNMHKDLTLLKFYANEGATLKTA